MAANRRAKILPGNTLAFGSVTGTYATLVGPVAGRGLILTISQNLNNGCIISLDGGATDYMTLAPNNPIAIDFGANGVEYSGTVSVKQSAAGANTSGSISAGFIRAE